MIAFRLQFNDEAPVLAGAEDLTVLSATITVMGPLGPKTIQTRRKGQVHSHISLGGLTARAEGEHNEHLQWCTRSDAKPGDRVLVEILEIEAAPAPIDRTPAEHERAYYERTKQQYLELKKRFEPED